MSEPQLCPQCGGEIPSGAPAGLCPKCLMLAGLESRPVADPGTAATQPPPSSSPSSASSGFVPPTVEEVAARFPQLEILELLGRGGMGAVYKARQRELDRLVAVKILPPEVSRDPAFAERFTREARALARLNHPNIVGVYDFGRTPSLPSPSGRGAGGEGSTSRLFYFIMEFVDGVNLRQAIQAGGMDPKQALAIVPQICDALQFAHDEGVVHRDIKPENILIDKRGRVKIADFGLAKLLGQESVDHGLTATQQVMGTLRYMAPEQMEGTKTVDHRADIYSLGVVFYELLTGELPIGRFAPPSKMVEIDVRLDEVVLRALEKKPEQRYQHASEVKTDMASIAGSPVASPPAASVGASSGPIFLLDETDRAARRYQHFLLLGGMALIIEGLLMVLLFIALLKMPALLPIPILFWIGGIALMIAAGRNRQQWEIEYLGHSLRFENSVYTSGRLIVDGKTMAAGGLGFSTELSARIPRGPGAGDRIVVKTNAGFLSFRCRIFVEPKSAAAPKVPIAPVAAAGATGSAGSDRGFVAAVATALIAAWIALLISTNGDKLPFGIRPSPPMIFGIHLLFPLVVAALAGGVFALIWPRANEPFLERIAGSAPMLLGCHLLVFSIAMFTSGYDSLEWDRVTFATPNVDVPQLQPREETAYQVGPWKTWVGPLAAVTAGVGLLALLLTLGTPPRLRARAAVLVLAGLVTLGAVTEYMALRPPKTITFTREQYRAFDPDHADGFDRFVREADADLESVRSMPYNPIVNPRGITGDYYNRIKAEYSKAVVHHYFQDEVAWFLLPGGLLLLCGLFTWRQAAVEAPAAGPRLAPLAAIGAFVGIAGPLVCVPGLIVAFLMLDQKEYLWGRAPSMDFMIGLIGMLVWTGLSLLAMSVLGAAAIGQIRRSGGKFYGLRLALLEALFCPAIALYCAAFGVLALVVMALPKPEGAETALFPPLFAVMVFVVIVTVAFIYWRLWRKLRQSPQEPDANGTDKHRAAAPSVVSDQLGTIGKISLWTAIIGIVAPIVLGLIGNLVNPAQRLSPESVALYAALWIVLELVAFGCGIVARHTATGKVGLVVSIISFALAGLFFAWSLVRFEFEGKSVPLPAPSTKQTSGTSTPGAPPAPNPFGLHPGKQVAPTPAELSHILAELPKEFTKGLLGDNAQSIRDLDTQVFAIDFDDGPADFWLQVRETGQQTFPARLPSRNEWDVWRIPKAKAHILMWIQPRQSVGMSDRLRGALAEKPPGCSLGIDVDGKAVARINYDTPVGGVNQSVPNPLWSGWASKDMHAGDGGFDDKMASQAILYIGRLSRAQGATTSCQLGLMYRPDRQVTKSGQ